MNFSDVLNDLMKQYSCTSKNLSNITGLSTSLISRYRNNERVPKTNSDQFKKLVTGLYEISNDKNITKQDIINKFNKADNFSNIEFSIFRNNFIKIIDNLNINISHLSQSLCYDSSFISRIKNGNRKPANLDKFINDFIDYIIQHYRRSDDLTKIKNITNIEFNDMDEFREKVKNWLIDNNDNKKDLINDFLSSIDNFDIEKFIEGNKNITIPSDINKQKINKYYYGIDGIKNAQNEFIKTAILSNSNNIFLYSEITINNIVDDEELRKKFILGFSILLNKKIHINIIHNINRPMSEIISGLETWLPLYITGLITPYYFDKDINQLFSHIIGLSESIALIGECPKNFEDSAKLYLTNKKEELDYYKKKSQILLSKAKPLVEIVNNNEDLKKFIDDKEVKKVKSKIFKNIDFYINKDKWIIINKNNEPKIHFIIYNSKFRKAIESFLNQKENT